MQRRTALYPALRTIFAGGTGSLAADAVGHRSDRRAVGLFCRIHVDDVQQVAAHASCRPIHRVAGTALRRYLPGGHTAHPPHIGAGRTQWRPAQTSEPSGAQLHAGGTVLSLLAVCRPVSGPLPAVREDKRHPAAHPLHAGEGFHPQHPAGLLLPEQCGKAELGRPLQESGCCRRCAAGRRQLSGRFVGQPDDDRERQRQLMDRS